MKIFCQRPAVTERHHIFCILSFIFLFLPSIAFSSAGGIIHVEAIGSIPVTVDTAKPDELVIEDAFKNAVAKAVETILTGKELDAAFLILDDKIYGNPKRYVLNYRVLSKEVMEDEIPLSEGGISIYTIFIEADVAVDLLTRDMTAAGIIQEEGIEKIAVAIFNLRDYKTFELFTKGMRGLRHVKDIHYNLFARDKIELVVEMTGDVQALKEELMGMDMKDWGIEVSASQGGWFSMDKIEIKFFPFKERSDR